MENDYDIEPFDVSGFAAPPLSAEEIEQNELAAQLRLKRGRPKKHAWVKGPLQARKIKAVSKLRPSALVVMLALICKTDTEGKHTVVLSNEFCEQEFGIDRSEKSRALEDLMTAGYVSIDKTDRNHHKITLKKSLK